MCVDVESSPSNWIRLYQEGMTGAEIVQACRDTDPLQILGTLARAKNSDPDLESRHRYSLGRKARERRQQVALDDSFSPPWRRRLNELKEYVRNNGRMPRQVGGDATETSLGRWLHAQRAKVSKGSLTARQRAALDAVGVWDSDRRENREMARFPERLRALAAFRARHRRWPTYMNRTDPEEQSLGTWLYTLRQAAREERLPERVRLVLDEHLPGWLP
ncbi:helicase associated domain-containing protein [Pseudarthrobacter sp. BIM B-2242]|uniref:helicase associated domain-containing protein n=1 Tax=Pseudarthrobacter sp. BIM B-2242 TaxID=2772401 RepID=UPI00168B47E1|nr:helicase associated domain-containing protein [Pseudarthrobacter sp. BIM B-2242]QOD05698.1 helicase associated domain-containing protein [Pseudarthrobacter sp. BIM B-2242]